MDKYLDANPEAGKRFYQEFHNKGKIIMLNLLRFKTEADYTNLENIKPEQPISGKEAFQLYLEKISSELHTLGSEVLFFGKSKHFLIGPESEKWDAVLLMEHQSVQKFLQFSASKTYLENAGHRTAALEDSRLLPSSQLN